MTELPRAPLPLAGAGDTIAAIATAPPPAHGALALLRLSGPAAHDIAGAVLSPWRGEPRTAYRATLRDPASGRAVDRPMVVVYAAPRSYTGEDSVEITVHGGAVTPALALSALLAAGARQALPGEFTRRSVANGKLDILQAEGMADLVAAASPAMHAAALAQLDGVLSRRVGRLRAGLVDLEALIAYDLDFPEEDDGPVASERVDRAVADLLRALDELLASARTGEMVRSGAIAVIAGAPNAGKSSLFNALLGSARAIVTDVPGTTRDAIDGVIDFGPWPVRLVDTAGLRATTDAVERLGIEVSEDYLRRADVVLVCGDGPDALADAWSRSRSLTNAPLVPVRTKSDLEPDSGALTALGASPAAATPFAVSAVTGAGLDDLVAAVARALGGAGGSGAGAAGELPLLTRERHRVAAARARDEVAAFAAARTGGRIPLVVAAVHLHAAAAALEEMVGVMSPDDVLDRVFSTFCIGK